MSNETKFTCSNCRHVDLPYRAVHLWDGKNYCQACVFRASPKLATLAKTSTILSERITANSRDAVRALIRNMLKCGVIVLTFLCFVAIRNGFDLVPMLLLGVVGLVLTTLIQIPAACVSSKLVGGTVELYEGCLTIRRRSRFSGEFSLRECQWYIGNAREAKLFCPGIALDGRAIIIECPLKLGFLWPRQLKVACGLTDESRDIWESLFRLSGLEPKVKHSWLSYRRLFRKGTSK